MSDWLLYDLRDVDPVFLGATFVVLTLFYRMVGYPWRVCIAVNLACAVFRFPWGGAIAAVIMLAIGKDEGGPPKRKKSRSATSYADWLRRWKPQYVPKGVVP